MATICRCVSDDLRLLRLNVCTLMNLVLLLLLMLMLLVFRAFQTWGWLS